MLWDVAFVGHSPLVGVEPIAEALPAAAAQPLLLHTFAALGSSQAPEQVGPVRTLTTRASCQALFALAWPQSVARSCGRQPRRTAPGRPTAERCSQL